MDVVGRRIRVVAPATTANLGPGFDSLGMALQFSNELDIEVVPAGLSVLVAGEGVETLPTDASNAVVRVMRRLFKRVGVRLPGIRIRQTNSIPLARGLGSSAAAIAAGLVGANALAGSPLPLDELVDMATAIEGHPDNVTACLVGGLAVTAVDEGRVYYARIDVPPGLRVVLYIPEFRISTCAARRHLGDTYSRADAVFNLSRAALTTAALATGRWDLLRIGMQDCMHQPYRAKAYPEMPHLIQAALDAGACGAALSGSGPTIAAFTDGDHAAVGAALEAAGTAHGLTGRSMGVQVDPQGVVIIEG